MKAIAAREAKNRFGTLMDAAQRAPIAIEKHGRPVAVLMSVEEYKTIKFSRLQAELSAGIDQLEQRFYWLAEHTGAGKSRETLGSGLSSFPQGRHIIFFVIAVLCLK